MNKFFYIIPLTIFMSSCGILKKKSTMTLVIPKLVTEAPMFVSAIELSELSTGMTKDEARSTLGGQNPYDILVAFEDGCELHQYKYLKPSKEISIFKSNKSEGLNEGERKYLFEDNDAFILYKNGTLESVLTNVGKKDALKVLSDYTSSQVLCLNNEPIKGCTDPKSLSYNPDAMIDDGKCEYPPCGYEINEKFNSKRPISDCNQKYTKILVIEEIVEENECDNCDIIEKLSKSNATLNITIDQNQNRPTKSTIKFGSSDDVKEEGKDSLKNKLKNKIKLPKKNNN